MLGEIYRDTRTLSLSHTPLEQTQQTEHANINNTEEKKKTITERTFLP